MPAKMTQEQFVAKAQVGSPNLTVLGRYVNNKTKVLVRCERCGQKYEVAPSSVMKGIGCPYCSGHRAISGVNDLGTTYPEVAKLWHPTRNGDVRPCDVKPQSNTRFWWLCPECGGEWEAVPGALTVRSGGCPYCSGHRVLAGFNDLATVAPEVARQWHPTRYGALIPADVTSGSDRKVWWRCERGHEWEATIASRVHGAGCPYCAGQRVIPGENDLAALYPEVARLWHPIRNGDLKPSDVMSHTTRKVWWLGECGHEWDTTVANMVKDDRLSDLLGKARPRRV
jgi:DNA-directed RNA polymerase subunit RPC12/RpoP